MFMTCEAIQEGESALFRIRLVSFQRKCETGKHYLTCHENEREYMLHPNPDPLYFMTKWVVMLEGGLGQN